MIAHGERVLAGFERVSPDAKVSTAIELDDPCLIFSQTLCLTGLDLVGEVIERVAYGCVGGRIVNNSD